MPSTFCEKCTSRLKIAHEFKKQSMTSVKYLQNFIQKINKEFQQSVPVYEEEDDEELEQFELTDSPNKSSDSSISKIKIQECLNIENSDKDERQEEEVITYHEIKRQDETEAVQIMTNLNFSVVQNDSEEPEVYQKTETAVYDILEVEDDNNSESGEIEQQQFIHSPKASMDMETNQLFYLNLKEDNLELIAKSNKSEPSGDEETARSSSMRKQKRVSKFQEHVRLYAESSGDLHKCTKCNKNFSTRTNLYRHLQSHDGMRNYICEICSKGFTQSGSLKQHQYIHTGQRPYKCNFCGMWEFKIHSQWSLRLGSEQNAFLRV